LRITGGGEKHSVKCITTMCDDHHISLLFFLRLL
jgi:hypothetical protein